MRVINRKSSSYIYIYNYKALIKNIRAILDKTIIIVIIYITAAILIDISLNSGIV